MALLYYGDVFIIYNRNEISLPFLIVCVVRDIIVFFASLSVSPFITSNLTMCLAACQLITS